MKVVQRWLQSGGVLGLAFLFLNGCATSKPAPESEPSSSPSPGVFLRKAQFEEARKAAVVDERGEAIPVIDAHLHVFFTGTPEPTSRIPRTREELFKEFREAGVVGAIAHSEEGGKGFLPGMKEHGIIQCYGVGSQVNLAVIEKRLKSRDFSCIKIYLGYVHRYAYDPAYRGVYRLAEKYDVPVVFHTGDTYSTKAKLKYADPLTVDEVAVDFPKVTFVIAHGGNPWIESAAEVAYKNPNVYLDGSAFLIGDLSKYSQEHVDQLAVKPLAWIFDYVESPDKLMFGSDWPLTEIKPYVDVFKRAIPQRYWRKVFHDNAARVFKLRN